MKKMRKMMALVLAVLTVMAFSSVSAFAGTVTNNTNHTYDVYQVFSGTQTTTAGDTKLGDIAWGSGVNGTNLLAALKTDNRFNVGDPAENAFADATTAKAVAEVLSAYTDDSDFAKAFANVADQHKTTKFASVAAKEVTPDLAPGYYLFVDTKEIGADDNDAKNSALLQITNKTEGLVISKKYEVPSFDKDIVENGSHVEAVDKAIGDTVTYELTGTLPTNYADYETYKYVFHDTLSKGQAYQNDLKVEVVNGTTKTDVTSSFTKSSNIASATDGTAAVTFTVGINDLKSITTPTINKDSKIVVTYTVKLTADAEIGEAGNKNEGQLEYSNNPNGTGEGTTKTPKDENLVFTYELDTTKVDGSNSDTKLAGAQFVLKATNGDHNGKYVQIDAASGKITGWLDSKPAAVDTAPTSGNTGVLVSGSDGLFKVYGLDAGSYELEEIKAPKGYNLLTEAVPLTINATVNSDETTGPALTSLTITGGADSNEHKADGKLPVVIENNGGTELPSTGGMGTTIFYILGALLVVGCGIVLVSKRRTSDK